MQPHPPISITILGSGTSTGVPVIGCRCRVCASGDPRDNRTRSSALVQVAGKNILIDSSTDLRQQALRHRISHIDAVLYTHTHADHVNGIDDLRVFNMISGAGIPIYGSAGDLLSLKKTFHYIFDEDLEEGYRPQLIPCPIEAAFELFGLLVTPIPLIHGSGAAQGYRIGNFAYLTDCSAIPETSKSLLMALDELVLDGLRHSPHSSHFNISQAIEATSNLGARRTWLTHLSHDVLHARDEKLLPPKVFFAHDGLCLHL